MGLVSTIRSVVGGGDSSDEQEGPPSHRCESCGEEYFTDPTVEISTCRSCGGTKVKAVT